MHPTDDPNDDYVKNPDAWLVGKHRAHAFLEKPAMFSLLPSLSGKAVLCVGCGAGEECVQLLRLGAARVAGIDISEPLLQRARQACPAGEFHLMNMEQIALPQASFDIVYSSLALDHVADWNRTLAGMRRVMKPDGTLLFSVIHPAHWSCEKRKSGDGSTESFLLGYTVTGDYESGAVFGDYFRERWIRDCWYGSFEVSYFCRPLSSMFREIRAAGFELLEFLEPVPVAQGRAANPVWGEIWSKIPQFAVFKLGLPSG